MMHSGILMNSGQRSLRSSEALLRAACFGVLSAKRDKVRELMCGCVAQRHGSLVVI